MAYALPEDTDRPDAISPPKGGSGTLPAYQQLRTPTGKDGSQGSPATAPVITPPTESPQDRPAAQPPAPKPHAQQPAGQQPVTPPVPQPPPPPPQIGPDGGTVPPVIRTDQGGGWNPNLPVLIQRPGGSLPPPAGPPGSPPPGSPPPGNTPPLIAPPPGNRLDLNDPSGNGLQSYLQGQVNNPSPMGSAPWQQAYQQGYQNLQDQATLAGANAQADAAKRGVYYGSPLTTSLGDISTQLQRGAGDLQSNLLLNYAQTLGQNQQNSIGNLFRYGENQNQADQFQARLGLDEANSGFAGAPGIDSTLGQTLGIGQPGYNPESAPDLSGFGALAGYLQNKPGSAPIKPNQYGTGNTTISAPPPGTQGGYGSDLG